MKKSIRITALLLAILMPALPLVGCDRIDEMRANQGFWIDAGSISFNGQTYKLLSPDRRYLHIEFEPYRKLEITEKNVPVLLSERYGKNFLISYDEVFIAHGSEYYCRVDKYDYVEDRIKHHGNMDYWGFYYNTISDNNKSGQLLTDEEMDVIIDIIMSVEGIEYGEWRNNWGKYYNTVYIYRCSEDMLFRKKSETMILFHPGGRYFIVDEDFAYFVPEEYNDLFENMLKEYKKIMLLKI